MSNPFDPLMHSKKHPKQDFQVERIAFFSDAVFAIAITLLVIEFRPPIFTKNTTASELWPVIHELKAKLIAVLLSFILIINYWIRHHTLFKFIHNYNRQIIMANMIVLLPIIFFPFTTSFLYENMATENELLVIPFRFFMLNNALAGITMYYFYWIVTKKNKNMSYPMTEEEDRNFRLRMVFLTMTFILAFLISFFTFKYSVIGILPVVIYNLRKKFFMPKKNTINIKTDVEQNHSTTD